MTTIKGNLILEKDTVEGTAKLRKLKFKKTIRFVAGGAILLIFFVVLSSFLIPLHALGLSVTNTTNSYSVLINATSLNTTQIQELVNDGVKLSYDANMIVIIFVYTCVSMLLFWVGVEELDLGIKAHREYEKIKTDFEKRYAKELIALEK